MIFRNRSITIDFMYFLKTCQKPSESRTVSQTVNLSLFALGRSFHHTSAEISIVSHPYSNQNISCKCILRSSKMLVSAKEVFL